MIYVGLSDETLTNFLKVNKNVRLFTKTIHPCKAKKYAEILNNSDKDYVLYDTNIIDYINLDKLMFVKNDLSTILFNDEFKEELTYMFPGEIILNKEEIL